MSEHQHRAAHQIGQATLYAVQADLTAIDADAVVNAANEQLAHGGGVAAALSRAGGGDVQRESDAWVAEHGPVGPGQAAVTTAGNMPAAHIVHVVGPRYRPGQDNAGLLRQAVGAALGAAADAGAASVALPAISAGIFGYPPAEATAVIAQACAQWLDEHPGGLRAVLLVGYDDRSAGMFAAAVRDLDARDT
ncbi:MAG TPA: macro domain-containing protein [Euzebyales bacterium]|nr:macro domain-containing protein [Euzebyales bacterium]